MKIEKIINNNIVSARNEDGKEIIVMGCGIGFGHRPEQLIDETKIEKIFRLDDNDNRRRFKELIAEMPLEYLQVSNDIISYTKDSLHIPLNQNVYLTLTDHINFAIDRQKDGMIFSNALSEEIKLFYPSEYAIGKHALYMIEERIGCRLCEDEAASIALHIVNAELNTAISTTFVMTKMMRQMLQMIEENLNFGIQATYPKDRLITNLKHLANRLICETPVSGRKDQVFYDFIIQHCAKEYKLISKVNEFIQKEYKCSMTEEECIYLCLNVKRISDLYEC